MKLLRIIDAHDYDVAWSCYRRDAVRAIIFQGDKLALVKCGKEGYYKFPGGGVEPNETHAEALARETLEETGLCIMPQTITGFGALIEKRRSIRGGDEIFEQHSYYYLACIEERRGQCRLDAYEAELDYHLEFVDPVTALDANVGLADNYKSAFLLREAFILEMLTNEAAARHAPVT